MVQTDHPGTRALDVFQQMEHYKRWKEDLQLAVDLGTNAIRYSVPWYRSSPAPGYYDWDWIAGPLNWLAEHVRKEPYEFLKQVPRLSTGPGAPACW